MTEYVYRVSFDVRVEADTEEEAERLALATALADHNLTESDPHHVEIEFVEIITEDYDDEPFPFDTWREYDAEYGTSYHEDLFGVR